MKLFRKIMNMLTGRGVNHIVETSTHWYVFDLEDKLTVINKDNPGENVRWFEC